MVTHPAAKYSVLPRHYRWEVEQLEGARHGVVLRKPAFYEPIIGAALARGRERPPKSRHFKCVGLLL
jgi:hypothetical protein